MTEDDIMKIVREVGDSHKDGRGRETFSFDLFGIEALKDRIAWHEREACAVMIENYALQYAEPVWALKITEAIRARNKS